MKQFFKFVLASMTGMILLAFLFLILLIGIVSVASKKDTVKVAPGSILKLSLNEEMPDRSSEFFDSRHYRIREKTGLVDVLRDITHAATDASIKGIYLDLSTVSMGYSSVEEIRNALLEFRKSGKFILAYGENISEKAYYLATAAGKIYLNPQGLVEFNGLSSEYTFFKGTLDRLGIEAQIFRVGKFKSFVEPFTLTQMSDANRQQIQSYLGSIYAHYMAGIASARSIAPDSLGKISSELKVQSASDALRLRLVDRLAYKDEVLEELKKASGAETIKDIEVVSAASYASSLEKETGGTDRIAVVYASGDIGSGEGDDNSIGSERFGRTIRALREDKKVKAIVLRVNSPGGSSLASEVIWREVSLAQKVKPVIVSMGDVAASGGYYISCAASRIFAQPNTITGSIGIFSIIPNLQKFFGDKLGITFDRVNTGKYSDIMTVSRPLTGFEKQIIQNQVNKGYATFLSRVASGRHRSTAEIDSIAQGRVYTGEQALKIGLVDQLGSFHDAILFAAKQARLSKYELASYPAQKSVLEGLLGDAGDRIKFFSMEKELGPLAAQLETLRKLKSTTGLQARLPFSTSPE